MTVDPRSPLLVGVSQYEVDFVVPRIGIDLPLAIDPFLLFKSRDLEFRQLHKSLLAAFNLGIEAVRRNDKERARYLFDFPEVSEIGLGYTTRSKRGSGVGAHIAELILETLENSPILQERGVCHVEEMQLLSAGIGPDRISDITANLLKRFLIEYTQRQCAIWSIALRSGVPLRHIYDSSLHEWQDSYENLPVSSVDGSPILLVPRRWVRVLPWINYDDFLRTEFKAYLSTRRADIRRFREGASQTGGNPRSSKEKVVAVTRQDLSLVERYIHSREQQAGNAHPALDYVDEDACVEAEKLKQKLSSIQPGQESASEYQRAVLEILNYLFNPDLIDGQPEVRTVDGTERRDIIFTNDSDESFWDYVRHEHSGFLLMFETKNMRELDLSAINQTATYLGDRVGRLGIIITRQETPDTVRRKIFSVWNDSSPRKVILTLNDAEIYQLLDLRCRCGSPTKWIQAHYRKFRTSLQ